MSEAASYVSFCHCNATAREISSLPGVCFTIHFHVPFLFPFPFPSLIAFPFPIPFQFLSFVSVSFPVPFSQPYMFSSPSASSLSLWSLGRLIPPLGAVASGQFSSSPLVSSIISCQFRGPTARKSPRLYCWQLGDSILALGSSLLCQEKRTLVRMTFLKLVICGLEQLTWSPKARGLSHYQLFIFVPGFVKHLRHWWEEGYPPLLKRRMPPPMVRPHQ